MQNAIIQAANETIPYNKISNKDKTSKVKSMSILNKLQKKAYKNFNKYYYALELTLSKN